MFKLLLFIVMILMISGCSSNNKQVSNKDHYAEDGYMGLTSANPSLLTTPNSRNYSTDVEAMKRALREVPNIKKTTIVVDGGNAYIHINILPGLTTEEVDNVSELAQHKLAAMSPQYYKIRVTVD
jgi:hypothetical protein